MTAVDAAEPHTALLRDPSKPTLQRPHHKKDNSQGSKEHSSRDGSQLRSHPVSATSTVTHHGPTFPAVAAVACAGVAYGAAKLTIRAYQHLRQRNMRAMLLDVGPILAQLGQTYWVDFGTLLGLHRDGDLILHDNDVDVAVLNPDWDALYPALHQALDELHLHTSRRYSIGWVTPSEDSACRWIRVYCLFGMMDVYGASHSGGKQDIQLHLGRGELCNVPHHMVMPTRSEVFRGVALQVPGDVPAVLEHRYGPTWMVPRYMDKGSDTIEQGKLYVKLLTALSMVGIRI